MLNPKVQCTPGEKDQYFVYLYVSGFADLDDMDPWLRTGKVIVSSPSYKVERVSDRFFDVDDRTCSTDMMIFEARRDTGRPQGFVSIEVEGKIVYVGQLEKLLGGQ